ncbi:MAG TPA: carboxypeptidase regulatory-like domain-containing protein [Chitinophagaceae bacterium]|nr:carboxypeptidase regulatory-like domain-containing protein [Chitinophagaceae bacterium]
MKLKIILSALFLVISFNQLFSQKLHDLIMYDTMIYVYKLDKTQSNFMIQKNMIVDSSILFTNLYKTYPRRLYKDDTLPNGNFIIVSITKEYINYRSFHKSSFAVKSKVIGNDLILFLNDIKSKANIEKAKIDIDGISMPFNDGYGGYVIQKSKLDKERLRNRKIYVHIALGDEYKVSLFNFNQGYKSPNSPRAYGANTVVASEGYMITDKPVYKPGDTLRVKAFLTYPKNGRPIHKKVTIRIHESQQDFTFTKTIKSASPGAYLFEWKIPDTLKIDRNFNIEIQYSKGSYSFNKQSSFYLEDYVLNTNKYDVSLLSEIFYAGEDITFYTSAKDANSFPIQGTQIKYKLSLGNVTSFLGDSLTLSQTQKANLFEKDTIYSYDNFMEFKIPSSVLPKINASYNLEVSFVDPVSFERKVIVKQFSKLTQKEKVLIYQNQDSLHLRCLYNLKDTARPYQIIAMSKNDTLFKKKVTSPYSFKLSPYTTKVIFIDKDSVYTDMNIVFNKLDITKVVGIRTFDSIHISFSFPFDEPVYYRILKGNQLVKSGKSRKLDFKFRDDSKDAYTILLTTNLNGEIESNFYKITYTPQIHKIKLQSSMPAQAFPGQKLPIEITATDYKNKPLRKINIAAYAVNKQFEERLVAPQINVPYAFKDLVEIKQETSNDHIVLEQPALTQNYILTTKHLAKYNLYKNEYYELRYPKNEMALLTRTIQSNIPEFSVAVTHKNMVYTPKYILVDGEPIYISDLNKSVYSFPIKSGVHDITIRYFDKKIVFKKITFEEQTKYWLGINIDSLKASSKNIVITDSLKVAQPNESEMKLLYSTLLLVKPFNLLNDTLIVKDKRDSLFQFIYSVNYQPKLLSIDGDGFYVFGPMKPNSNAILNFGKQRHVLKVSPEYAHYYDEASKAFTTKNIGKVKGAIFNFNEIGISDFQFASLFKPDTIKPLPQVVDMDYNREALIASTIKPEQEYSQNYRSANAKSNFHLYIKNDDKLVYAKSLWIISKSHPDQCDFKPNIQPNSLYHDIKNGEDGRYDFYFLMNDDKLVILKDILLYDQVDFYINPSLFKTEKLTNDKLAAPLKVYSDLTKLPLLPFYFPPEESSDKIKEVNGVKRGNPYFHGIITDQALQPISDAMILLELNGIYKYGGYTNANGEFEILNIMPGSYQVKLFQSSYQMKHYPAIFMKQGYEYELNASLNESESLKPVLETINQDFRFLSFGGSKQKEIFKIQLFDKDTRDILKGASIKFFEKDKLLDEKRFMDRSDIEIPFPIDPNLIYNIEIQREGYIPIQLQNIRFINTMYYTLFMFMSKQDELKLEKSKAYDLRMNQVNIEVEERLVNETNVKDMKISYTDTDSKGVGEVYGRIADEKNKGLDFASVTVSQKGIIKGGAKTDINGNYRIKPLLSGTYDFRVTYVGYIESMIKDIVVYENKKTRIDIRLEKQSNHSATKDVVVRDYKVKLIDASSPGRNVVNMNSYNSYAAPLNASPTYSNYINDESVDLNISGARSSNTLYMVDGIMIRPGKSDLTLGFSNTTESLSAKYGSADSIYVSNDMINQVAMNSDISQTRKKFTDIGYWEPNHITNKQGKTNFEIRLPDNITTWQSNIIAMGKHRLHGIQTSETKVFKPLQTMSIIPQFIWDQDKVYAKAKFTNLTKDSKDVSIRILLNDKVSSTKKVTIKNDYVDSVLITASNTKPIQWRAGLQFNENYKDEEDREILVYSSALKLFSNQNILMEKDSSYQLKFAKETKGFIILNNTLYEKIIEEINQLSNYEYGCVEQTSSKLKALLCKQKINGVMGLKENLTPAIYNLINKLSNYQNIQGTWGWWAKESPNWRMTIYAMDVLFAANNIGYSNNSFASARDAINANFYELNISDQLYALYVFQKMNFVDQDMKDMFEKIQINDLKTIDKIYYHKINEGLGRKVNPNDFYALTLEMNNRLQTPYAEDFFNDPKSTMFTSYFLFSKTSMGKEWVKMFRDKLVNGQLEKNLNTYAKANMIEALTSSIENTGNKPITSQIIINDTLKIKSFPYSMPISGSNYTIKHTGGDVYLNTAEEKYVFLPKKSDSVFKVTTSFNQFKQTTESLKTGEPCFFNVEIDAYRSQEYVMVEVPIPSGMRIVTKKQFSGCTIEYFKNKIVIFYSKLSMDKHQLSFEFIPNLTGSFTLPAAKCSLMYYPYIFGNNETRTIEVK